MRIQFLSDLHLERGDAPVALPDAGADLLVLAGDIGAGTAGLAWADAMAPPDLPVVCVMGNHEYYGRDYRQTLATARAFARRSARLHLLERGIWSPPASGVRVLGATLWTDFALGGAGSVATALAGARRGMRVARSIADRQRPDNGFYPEGALEEHRRARAWLARRLDAAPSGTTTIVVTHHAPHPRSVEPRAGRRDAWAAPRLSHWAPAAMASDCTGLITAGVDLWIHGHTHRTEDYRIGGCRIVSNPGAPRRGRRPGFDPGHWVAV